MQLTQSLQKSLQAMTALQVGSSTPMMFEEWCDLTKVEAKRRGLAIAARLSGRAKLFKEKLD